MRILIVGMGSIGRRHAHTLSQLGHTLISYEPTAAHQSYAHALHANPDAVLICSPPECHYEQARLALQLGLRVFCEKPLTVRATDALDLVQLAHPPECLAVGYMLRAHPRLRHWPIQQWHTGTITCHWRRPTPATYSWPGVLWETSHELDAGLYIFGAVESVRVLHLTAHRAVFIATHTRCPSVTYNLCSDASIYHRAISAQGSQKSWRVELTPDEIAPCYQTELTAFLAGHPLCTGLDGLAAVKFAERIIHAAPA